MISRTWFPRASAALLLVALGSSASLGVTFNDIQYWVGSGSNQAGFVMDWNDAKSPESLVWGFRWDGSATGETMFKAIVAADPRLFAHVSTAGSFGVSPYGAGYDLNNDAAFGTSAALAFDSGGLAISDTHYDGSTPTQAGDHWKEGWFTDGFWDYYQGGNNASPVWLSSGSGMSARTLTNNAWDGWSYATGFNFTEPSEPTTVPEPAAITLVAMGTGWVLMRRRRLLSVAAPVAG